MIKILLLLALSGSKFHLTSSEPDDAAGVKYKRPVIYSNLPPPVLYFPNFPEKQKISSRGDAEAKQIEYVPFPYKDLPVLVYHSDNQPPVHVVEKRPNKERSKDESSLKKDSNTGHSSHVKDTYSSHSKPLSHSETTAKDQQMNPSLSYQHFPHIQNQQFISIGISAAQENPPHLSAYNSNFFGKQAANTEQGKVVQVYQAGKEQNYGTEQMSTPEYSSKQPGSSPHAHLSVSQQKNPQASQYSEASYLKQNSSGPYSQTATQYTSNQAVGHQYAHIPTTSYQIMPQQYSQSHNNQHSMQQNYQVSSIQNAGHVSQKMSSQGHLISPPHTWQQKNAQQNNQMIQNHNVPSPSTVSPNNYNALPARKQQMMYQTNVKEQENSQQHLGISISTVHVPSSVVSSKQNTVPNNLQQQENLSSMQSNTDKEFDIDGHQYVSIGIYPMNVPDDGYNNGLQYYNILVPQNENVDQSQNDPNSEVSSDQKGSSEEMNQHLNTGYQIQQMENFKINPRNIYQQENILQKMKQFNNMQKSMNDNGNQNRNQLQSHQQIQKQQLLHQKMQQQNTQHDSTTQGSEDNPVDYQQILIHIPHEVIAEPQISILQDNPNDAPLQGENHAYVQNFQNGNNPYNMPSKPAAVNEKPIVPKMMQFQTPPNFGEMTMRNYGNPQIETNSGNVPRNQIFLFSDNPEKPVQIIEPGSSFVKPLQFSNHPMKELNFKHGQHRALASTLYPQKVRNPFAQAFKPFQGNFLNNNPAMFSGSRMHYNAVKSPFMPFRNFYPKPFSDPFLQMGASRIRSIYTPPFKRNPLLNIERQDLVAEASENSPNVFDTNKKSNYFLNIEKSKTFNDFLHSVTGNYQMRNPVVNSYKSSMPTVSFYSEHTGVPDVFKDDKSKFLTPFRNPSQTENQGRSKHKGFIEKLVKISNAFLSQSQTNSQLTSQEDWKLIQDAVLQQIEDLLSPKSVKESVTRRNDTSNPLSESQKIWKKDSNLKGNPKPPIIVYKGSKPPIEVYGSKDDIENSRKENASLNASSVKNPALSHRQDKDSSLEYLKFIYSFLSNFSRFSPTKRNDEDSSEEASIDQTWLPESNSYNMTANIPEESVADIIEPQADFKVENSEPTWLPDSFSTKSASLVNEDLKELLTLLHKEEKSDIIGY